MTLTFTILGCGSSGGVPRIGQGWGACDPNEPRNRRRRCSLLVERIDAAGGRTTVLVDTSPDMREQLLDAGVTALDGVIYTHAHADHTHGIDDLRPLAIHQRKRLDLYLDEPTSRDVRAKFGYIFETPPGSSYPPICTEHRILLDQPLTVTGTGGSITALPFVQDHGDITALGFRFGDLAYSSDLRDIPAHSLPALAGLKVWIVDALRYRPHPTHFSLEETLSWIKRLAPERAILTNLHSDLDYAELCATLPRHVEPAYDGMRITL